MADLQFLPIEKIIPHPQNPRKQLGDLTELADSIKKNGVYQNLTVVPNKDGTYTIIIGHRRRAAAELAGVKELPCIVTDMTEKEQLSTMLLENMQREDLTLLEQAEGFQLMIDLGENVKSISEQTGFSQSTVRHRLKINELDSKKLKEVSENADRPISLKDYILLEKVKDTKKKNDLIKYLGTSNLEYYVSRALENEKTEKFINEFRKLFSDLGYIDISDVKERHEEYTTVQSFAATAHTLTYYERPSALEEKEQLYFTINEYGWIYTYRKIDEEKRSKEAAEQEKKEEERKNRVKRLEIIAGNAENDIYNFVKNYKHEPKYNFIIIRLLVYCTIKEPYKELMVGSVAVIENPKRIVEESTFEDIEVNVGMANALLRIIIDTYFYFNPFDFYGDFDGATINKDIMSVLKKLGYKAPDEVIKFFDGTHEAYK